jgi:GMP synthase-like glutamine amidotransferase
MPCCLAIQHVEPECPFAIGDAFESAGVSVEVRRVFAGDGLPPDLDGYRALVVMGGPMSAARDDGFPTRGAEMGLLAQALDRQIPVLGVCLGAQLLALAAGGSVHTGPAPEIGWGQIELTRAADTDPLFAGAPSTLTVLHWHGDTYVRPPGAVQLASSQAYAEQAFRVGAVAWGLQFHLEVEGPAVDGFAAAFADEVRGAGLDPALIRSETARALDHLTQHRDTVLDRFAGLAAGAAGAALPDVVAGRVIEPA